MKFARYWFSIIAVLWVGVLLFGLLDMAVVGYVPGGCSEKVFLKPSDVPQLLLFFCVLPMALGAALGVVWKKEE